VECFLNVVLLRVGIDSGSGGIQGPLFRDGSFEFIAIPDTTRTDSRTYGNTVGIAGRHLINYFPAGVQARMTSMPMHVDPEWATYTYGDPTSPKAGLRRLQKGDILAFYAGLEGWGFDCPPALYLVGYFVVSLAGVAIEMPENIIRREFMENFHVKHPRVFERDIGSLVLVKGGPGSRLLRRAYCISSVGKDARGAPLKRLSNDAIRIFGDFGGRTSIQRSPPRWVTPDFTSGAREFLLSLS
jgi:Nucleotide modification associated domain 3